MEPGPAQPKLQLNEAYFHYVIQQCFSTQDLSQQAASDFIKSFAKGTMSGYGGIYKEWLHFAHQIHFNPLQPMASHPMRFLALCKLTCFPMVTAAMAGAVLPGYQHLWTNPDLSKVIHGIDCWIPCLPALNGPDIWDPQMALDLFHTWPDNHRLSLM